MRSCIRYEAKRLLRIQESPARIAKISLSAGQNWLPISMPTFPKHQDYFGRLTLNGLLLLLECRAHYSTSLLHPERQLGLSPTSSIALSVTGMRIPNKASSLQNLLPIYDCRLQSKVLPDSIIS